MKIFSLVAAFAFLLAGEVSQAQAGPLSADVILQDAMQQAKKENKHVIVIFHASWCGWCHKMDSSINDKSCRKFFEDNYVIRHLVVDESKDKKNLENPGSDELRAKYHGDGEGIPFWLVFDKEGNIVSDSQVRPAGASLDSKGENVGCPTEEAEVAFFIDILKKTSHMAPADEMAIQKRFRQNADK